MTTETQAPSAPKRKQVAGLDIIPVKEVPPMGAFLTIYGAPGHGKTATASNIVYSELASPVLYVDAEGGVRTIRHLDNVDSVQVSSWTEVENIMESVKSAGTKFPYRSIIFDNLSEMRKMLQSELTDDDPDVNMQVQDWGTLGRKILFFVRQCRDVARYAAVNIVLIAWDQGQRTSARDPNQKNRVVTTTDESKRMFDFNPALAKEFPGIVDIIGYLYISDEDTGERCLSFRVGSGTVAKFRRSAGEAAMSIPDRLYSNDPNNHMLADMVDTLVGGKLFPANKYKKGGPTT